MRKLRFLRLTCFESLAVLPSVYMANYLLAVQPVAAVAAVPAVFDRRDDRQDN